MKPLFVALLLAAMTACIGSEEPESRYFLVSFAPDSTEMLPEARAVLDSAVGEARGGDPREVAIRSYVGRDGSKKDLAEERAKSVEQALVAGGVTEKIIHRTAEEIDPADVARFGNGIVIQVARGTPPSPLKAEN